MWARGHCCGWQETSFCGQIDISSPSGQYMFPEGWNTARIYCWGAGQSMGTGDYTLWQLIWFGAYSAEWRWISSHQRRMLTARCFIRWHTLPWGSGCTSSQLAESTQVCLSSRETSALRGLKNQRGKGVSSVSGIGMAQSAVVPRTGRDADSPPPPVDYPTIERPPLSSTRNDMAPKPRVM